MDRWLVFRHLFPTQCVLCGAPAVEIPNLCEACARDLPAHGGPRCPRCARSLAGQSLCGDCQIRQPAFQKTYAALRYEGLVVPLIHAFKFRGDLCAGAALSHMMLRHVPADMARPGRLVPVPLHRKRLSERGFNQSLELARVLGRRLGIPVAHRVATRVRNHAPQPQLTNNADRWRNVKEAFHVKQGQVVGRQLTIVDDVITSGATADALARCLYQAGAERVTVWVATRAG